jgi:protein-disulfide isomerase
MKPGTSALLVILLAFSLSAEAEAQQLHFDPTQTYSVPIDGSPVLGPEAAPVTIVEFSDFYCGYCRRVNGVLRHLMRLYPGKIRLVFVHAPLDRDEGTLPAEASLAAAAQGKFWPMHDRIFAGGRAIDHALLERYATEIGLDLVQFRADLNGRKQLPALRRDVSRAISLGVASTPTFFVNGKPILGARDLGTFINRVDEALAEAETLIRAGTPAGSLYQTLVAKGLRRGSSTKSESLASPKLVEGQRYTVGPGLPSHRLGPQDAPVTLVEFSDFQCPFCARVRPTIAALKRKYGEKLRVVYRHFPLAFHAEAALAAEAAVEAGEQGKFWEYHAVLGANPKSLTRADLEAYADQLGLNMPRFRQALDDRRHLGVVGADMAEGARIGVRGTPSLFINGVAVLGSKPMDVFTKVIDAELKRGAPVPAAPPKVKSNVEHHVSILYACRDGDEARAKELYATVKDRKQRRLLRQDCKSMGIELPK